MQNMVMIGVFHLTTMRHISFYGIHHPFKLAGLDPQKNVGFVNENVSPQSMFSYGALKDTNPRTKNVTEAGYHFDENLFNNFEDGTNLDGYLQTERYFKHIQQEIRADFDSRMRS